MPVIGAAAAAELDHAIDREHDGRTAQSTELERATDGFVADDEGHLIHQPLLLQPWIGRAGWNINLLSG